ncbi:TRAP transporter small permease [Halomonas elongata]|uniref:TRAP transporter small permease protein n=1 Tax=Halomonas elongata (strain ATCC 33173 / DSM 2581 / NBRC 15536 / NCIMB 2198 / 1H9) TaxID=768066 RepID=E1V9T4_HALED|nr:TRAP transporter small permease [Halomonas elongata]WBF19161.1 TRAP transporter small permease [Halomonas elongata]WPU48021.1 TRAP transporter small permease [Halomonas elongata DSM 2581]CBV41918.1 TRAP transporter small transmembrane protein [Halomonas elongata DSM 2581]
MMSTTPAHPRGPLETLTSRLGQLASGLARLGAWLGMLLIVYMLGHILLEIALRLFGHSTFVLDEFIGYSVAAMTFLSLPYALEQGGLIRVSLVLERFPKRWRWPFELFASVSTLLVFGWLAHFWTIAVQRSHARGIVSETLAETPLWIPQGAVLLGLYLLCLILVVRTLRILVERATFDSGES